MSFTNLAQVLAVKHHSLDLDSEMLKNNAGVYEEVQRKVASDFLKRY